jgi:hypothetical protein
MIKFGPESLHRIVTQYSKPSYNEGNTPLETPRPMNTRWTNLLGMTVELNIYTVAYAERGDGISQLV